MKSHKYPKNTPKHIKPLKKSHPTYLPPKFGGKTPKLGTLYCPHFRNLTHSQRLNMFLDNNL